MTQVVVKQIYKWYGTRNRLTNGSEPQPNGCWEWSGRTNKYGYGVLTFWGRDMLAHRAAYLVHFGYLPSDLYVCHKCDNPSCINPSHLFLGTARDNLLDCVKKGRHHPGRLTDEQVLEIYGWRGPARVMAEKHGISNQYVYNIRWGQKRTDVTGGKRL